MHFLHCRVSASLKKRLLSSYNLDAVKSIAWGVNHEDTAIKSYEKFGATVVQTGKAQVWKT